MTWWVKLYEDINCDPRFLSVGLSAQAVYMRILPMVDRAGHLNAVRTLTIFKTVALMINRTAEETASLLGELANVGLVKLSDDRLQMLGRGELWSLPDDDNAEWASVRRALAAWVFARDDYKCSYCGRSGDLTLDHIMPKSRGGSHEPGNLTTACRPCNSSKGARTPQEWRAL